MDAVRRAARNSERFWFFVVKAGINECWLWRGGLDSSGYGCFRIDGDSKHAHRYSYEIHNSVVLASPGKQLIGKLLVLHTCDNRSCVNPNHLFIGTQKDNIKDRDHKERQSRGEKRYNHKLTEEDIKEIRRLYVPYKYGITRLAREFGVHFSTIDVIVKRKGWKHVL